jgi:hypothetical protein
VHVMDGHANHLTNGGTLTTVDGIAGMAVLAGAGDETIENSGMIVGSIDLGTGTNQINNLPGGILKTGSLVDLGGGLLSNDGVLEPGGSETSRLTTMTGDLDFSSTSFLKIELGGDLRGDEYDVLEVLGDITLQGGTLEVSLINDFVPSDGSIFDILDFESLSGTFTTVTLPVGFDWNTTQLFSDGILTVVPEPSSMLLLVAAACAAVCRVRRHTWRTSRGPTTITRSSACSTARRVV